MQEIDWNVLVHNCFMYLRIAPKQFWSLTSCEFLSYFDQLPNTKINRNDLAQLIQQFEGTKNV
jgi:hypothetical protein